MKHHCILTGNAVFILISLFAGCSWFSLEPYSEIPTPAPTDAPKIQIRQGSTILDSYSMPYNFGYVTYGETSNPVVYTIENIGGSILIVNRFDTNTSAAWWLINGQDTNPSGLTVDYELAHGQTQTFTITFQPDRTNYYFDGGVGVWSNDPVNYDFYITVEGYSP